MTYQERIKQQEKYLVDGMNLRLLAEECVNVQGMVVFLLDTYQLWSPENTFTFPDGVMIERGQWEDPV